MKKQNKLQTFWKKFRHHKLGKFINQIMVPIGNLVSSDVDEVVVKKLGATHLRSSPSHPQTNGQVERVNDTLKQKS